MKPPVANKAEVRKDSAAVNNNAAATAPIGKPGGKKEQEQHTLQEQTIKILMASKQITVAKPEAKEREEGSFYLGFSLNFEKSFKILVVLVCFHISKTTKNKTMAQPSSGRKPSQQHMMLHPDSARVLDSV